MKTRNILLVTLAVILAAGGAFSVFAYEKKGRMPFGKGGIMSAEGIIERFSDELELTEEQKTEILPILEEKLSQVRERFHGSRGSKRHGFREEGGKMWQETEAQLAEILTEEQMQTLRAMKGSHMGRFMHSGFAGRAGRFQKFMGDLDLKPEQREEIFTIFGKYQETRQKGMQNFLDMHAAMSEILLQEELDEQKVRELFQQQAPQWEERFVEHANMLSEIKTVLSPEQVETLQKKSADVIGKIQNWHGKGQ